MRTLACIGVALAAFASGCSGNDERVWSGPPQPAADGSVSVAEFAAYQEAVDEAWERSAVLVAAQFTAVGETRATSKGIRASSSEEGTGPETVTVTFDGLLDDSVRAERWTLELEPSGSVYRLVSARLERRCQPGRGHEEFSPEPCA